MTTVPDSVIMSATLRQALTMMAKASPAYEICALLGGRDNEITSIYPVANVAGEPTRHFLLDAEGQISAMKMMREAGESLRGIFHTHPLTPAEPSTTDASLAAYPHVYYLIASLAEESADLQAYYFDGHDFQRVRFSEQ